MGFIINFLFSFFFFFRITIDGEDLNPKKRNRTTPEQLLILEEAFLKNPTPTSQVRDAIAEKVEMSSRSVQIWFQNRRAKLKLQVFFTYYFLYCIFEPNPKLWM